MIPAVMKLRIHSGKFRMHLWIPLILLWLLLIVLSLLLLPFIVIAWMALAIRGWQIPMFRFLAVFFELLGALRETEIHVNRPGTNAEVHISLM